MKDSQQNCSETVQQEKCLSKTDWNTLKNHISDSLQVCCYKNWMCFFYKAVKSNFVNLARDDDVST